MQGIVNETAQRKEQMSAFEDVVAQFGFWKKNMDALAEQDAEKILHTSCVSGELNLERGLVAR